ncbi:SpoIIE family protein phosphatase [Streptomyces sp. NPDC008141]|uniref:SpoIIE family protein phosphatase n=1 Tax=Streptomyces sp. NPDC008141 TaxID=3364815 RepID=UPI0036EAF384
MIDSPNLHLEPSESLLLHTDGITAARGTSNDPFGEERLADALNRLGERCTAQDAIDAVTEAVRVFTGGNDRDDDQAALVLTATSAVGLTTTA